LRNHAIIASLGEKTNSIDYALGITKLQLNKFARICKKPEKFSKAGSGLLD